MTDKELLELAAKAMGAELLDCTCKKERKNSVTGKHWNLLTDDSDALRLAVKLRLWMRYKDDGSVSICWYDDKGIFAGNVTEQWGSLRNGDGSTAHVRRAIVRAAAEIGRVSQ